MAESHQAIENVGVWRNGNCEWVVQWVDERRKTSAGGCRLVLNQINPYI
jgi:hypothetical protein